MRPLLRANVFSAALVVVGGVLGLACSRTPPEPAPAATTNGPSVLADKPATRQATVVPSAAPDAGARCIAATPAEAPPIPPPATPSACPPDPDGIPKLKTAQVAFPEAAGNPKVEVELVTTEREIQRGLMYRMTMPESHGMLFTLDERRDHTFWMHNTCMSLDMLFVDDDGTVVGIVEGAAPLTDATRSVGCPSSWVLEVNAGWCRRHGVRAGQKMGIPSAAR
jgi:uncharacterized membrane protein (UPF0127 family)